MKPKRVWTDEQRRAAAKRCRKMVAERKAQRHDLVEVISATPPPSVVATMEQPQKVRAPEVQAVIDTMTPERKAKLANLQARQMAQLSQTREGQEALERLEQRRNPMATVATAERLQSQAIIEPPKPIVVEVPMKVPFRLTGSQSGLMISELGPCHCGHPKLSWHPICLRVKAGV
jgi:hypothetical protein